MAKELSNRSFPNVKWHVYLTQSGLKLLVRLMVNNGVAFASEAQASFGEYAMRLRNEVRI
jgi:hypothetical protein